LPFSGRTFFYHRDTEITEKKFLYKNSVSSVPLWLKLIFLVPARPGCGQVIYFSSQKKNSCPTIREMIWQINQINYLTPYFYVTAKAFQVGAGALYVTAEAF
jgi:hypothetical protein